MRSSAAMSGYSSGDLAEALQEQPVGELHDVRLVDRRDALAAVRARVLEGVARDARGRGRRDDLERLHDARERHVCSRPL
jgi:hypothetical protein